MPIISPSFNTALLEIPGIFSLHILSDDMFNKSEHIRYASLQSFLLANT